MTTLQIDRQFETAQRLRMVPTFGVQSSCRDETLLDSQLNQSLEGAPSQVGSRS
ncbi:unnamed protein product [Acidithrix sp. C25]|nr:unnamed protein product [Acidithrix sp. C25]